MYISAFEPIYRLFQCLVIDLEQWLLVKHHRLAVATRSGQCLDILLGTNKIFLVPDTQYRHGSATPQQSLGLEEKT